MNTAAASLTVAQMPGFLQPRVVIISRVSNKAPLPQDWEGALLGWATWLRVGGKREATIRLRSDHLRSIARRSKTTHPSEITLNKLVILCSERPWSAEHRKSVRSSLLSFFDWATSSRLVASNPAIGLPKIAVPPPRPRPAPDEVWFDLLAAAPPRERLMALLAGEAGLRRGEVAAVHSDDLIRDADGWSLLVKGKGGRQRAVPLTDSLAAQIRTHQQIRGYLFPGQIDGHISASWVGTIISRLMPPGWTIHRLRHRYGTRGYAGTRDLRAVQEALGHASVATTQRYVAVSRRDVRLVSESAGENRPCGPVGSA